MTYGRIVRTSLTADEMAAPIDFAISLRLPNREELEARVNRGEILSRAALEAYLPAAADYARVRSWLLAQGFAITLESGARHAIFARGSNARTAAAFGIQFARVATGDGEFTSAVTAPALPDEIAGVVTSIRGLQPHLIRHPLARQRPQDILVTESYYAITPAAVAAAYQAPANLSGAGQTIAIVGDSIPDSSDLAEFWAQCAIGSTGGFAVANVQGGPGADTTDQFEITMDVEWSAGIAPAANIRLYAVPFPLSADSEAAAYTQILNDLPSNPTIHQVTESYGGIESGYGNGNTSLLLLIAQGVTCFAASDDGGSNPDPNTGTYNPSAPLSVSYPASDPSMTGVGGTTLIFPRSSNGQHSSPEVAWSLTTYQGVTGATGGGISGVFDRPSWQVGIGLPAGGTRCVPDVSAMAYTGAASNDMPAFVYQAGTAWSATGTSISSPIWAGLCALINQSMADESLSPVGFLNPKIYTAAGRACFTDITSGNNGAYNAGVGYDLCTGIGTPLVTDLITYLSSVPQSPWIYTQPAGATVLLGQPARFSVTVGGYPQPGCRWQISTDDGVSWNDLSGTAPYGGAATQTLTITGVAGTMDGCQFRCVVTNALGSATSKAVTLTVHETPVFTIQPVNQTVLPGATATFTAEASAIPPPTYQWQVSENGGSTWASLTDTAPYSGTATGTLTITGATAAMAGYQYQCLASNSLQSGVASSTASLAITSAGALLQNLFPLVLGRPVDSGALAAFSTAISGGMTPAQVYADLIASPEFQAWQVEPVIRLYLAAFNRIPDYAGLQNWSAALHAGSLSLTDAANGFATSAEFLQTYGALDNTGFVEQLYLNVLGREADTGGLNDWVSLLNGGASRGAVLIGFSESDEFKADSAAGVEVIRLYYLLEKRAPTAPELQTWLDFLKGYDQTDALYALAYPSGIDNAAYIQAVFSGFLRRDADAGALNSFGAAMAAGAVTPASLVDAIMSSDEFQQDVAPVARLYLSALLRVPDQPGLDAWVNYIRAGNTLQSMADLFASSAEFMNRYGAMDNTAYVTALYQNILGRQPDPDGLADWVGQLDKGTATRSQVLIGFAQSQEAVALFAPTMRTFLHYFAFFNTAPTQAQLDYWTTYLTTLTDQMRESFIDDL